MDSNNDRQPQSRFKLYHNLMRKKVRHILLISAPYEAWIMEADCRLSEQIIHEYQGLNLSRPPRLTWVSSLTEAVEHLKNGNFDLVITVSPAVEQKALAIGNEIKRRRPEIPVVLLTHQEATSDAYAAVYKKTGTVDFIFYWTGSADILVGIIKCVEDRFNVVHDTQCVGIRVILFVEDSPFYLSTILPVLYKELVIETQSVIDDGLNEEHRLLYMRARPKIIVTHNLENALELYRQFEPYVLGVISDVCFPHNGKLDPEAGFRLLRHIKQERFDIPLLMTSSKSENADLAARIPASFVDKNSPALQEKIKSFLMNYLGFGDFLFKMPDGRTIGTARTLFELEQKLHEIPDDSFVFHCHRNDFSRWLFSLSEVELASRVRPLRDNDFNSVARHRSHLIEMIKNQRLNRQKGIIVNFDEKRFDPDTEFLKIGKGSLGGKARGLSFMSYLLHKESDLIKSFDKVDIFVPQTLVITTEGFDAFIELNRFNTLINEDLSDEDVVKRFMAADFPETLRSQLESYLEKIRYPLAVRSSSLLEDGQFKGYAGLYRTYMLANDHKDLNRRLEQLINAVKMIYASTYFEAPKTYSQRVGNRIENEKMAVIIQHVVGSRHGHFYYPSISGVAQSLNYYPFSEMKLEDGVANIALGLGKSVMEGEKNLRFCPRFPDILPQRTTVEDILQNSQRFFYAITMGREPFSLGSDDAVTLQKREISDAVEEHPVRLLSSTYQHDENRIRDSFSTSGYPVLTFASILKHKAFPLPRLIEALLILGREKLCCPVEIEFAVDFPSDPERNARFAVLQIRPMSSREDQLEVEISEHELDHAFCISHQALGNTANADMVDLVYVKPETFDPSKSTEIANEIRSINSKLYRDGRKYILLGPGRWGSADPWLGIPIKWEDICGVGAIIESTHPLIHAEPSQGSHFFHNLTCLGINYFNVGREAADRLDWSSIAVLPQSKETLHMVHATVQSPFLMKVDGRKRLGILMQSKKQGI